MSNKFQFRRVRMPDRGQCKFGEGNAADVNGDGVVNVLDLVAITKAMKRDLLAQ